MINNLRWIGVLGAFYVACAAVGTAQAAPDDRAEAHGPGSIGMEPAVTGTTASWLTALGERSAALNRAYGPSVRIERRLGAPGPNWLVGVKARSSAMNRTYGLGDDAPVRAAGGAASAVRPDDRSGVRGRGAIAFAAAIPPTVASTDDGFAWGDAALSGGATLAVGVLLGAGAVSIRRRHGLHLR
jgi:hypothetical protein